MDSSSEYVPEDFYSDDSYSDEIMRKSKRASTDSRMSDQNISVSPATPESEFKEMFFVRNMLLMFKFKSNDFLNQFESSIVLTKMKRPSSLAEMKRP